MKIESCIKESFSVIGKEGSTEDGAGFVQNIWADAQTVEKPLFCVKQDRGFSTV